MSSKEKTYKSQVSTLLDDFVRTKRSEKAVLSGKDEGDVKFPNVLEFIDTFKILPFGLYPVQKFILKVYYNIPLNDTDKTIKITDRFGKEVKHEFTEKEYLRFLYDQGRCNIKEQDGKSRNELILVCGRRSGKSEISSIIAGYETFKLLARGNPQSYYGMPSGSDIRLLCVANDKEQASIVFGNMQGHIEKVDYFKSAFANSTQQYLRFRTEEDKKVFGPTSNKASITVTFKSSVAKGLRGRAVICAIMDEIAFFIDDGMTSADKVYSAINPSLAQFSPKDPKNKHKAIGNTEGRMILISSPASKDGFFYKQYVKAMSGERGSEGMLVIQAPTWEVNPTLSPEYYEREYFKDPRVFTTEHGAEFSDRTRGWIEDARDLEVCIDPDLRPKLLSLPREPHFLGIDFGLSNDGTAVALTRLANKKIELAYHEVWYPRKAWDVSNPHLEVPWTDYAKGLSNTQRLDIEAIGEWLLALSKRFYIVDGVFDQWAGPIIEQIIHKIGLTQIKMRNFSVSDSSHMFSIFKSYLFNKNISLYDYPRPESTLDGMQGKHSPLISELLELQANSGGKNIIIVEAPKISGKHDDVSDALARSVLLASEYIAKYPDALEFSHSSSSISSINRIGSYSSYQRQRAKNHGVVQERTIPRSRIGNPRRSFR